ncbi:hypothetical protein EON82_26415, partial [bacterium]
MSQQEVRPMVRRGAVGLVIVVGLSVVGCGDRAEPEFTLCGNLQTAGNLPSAREACAKAVAADATSKAGQAAAQKLAEIDQTLKKREEQAALEAKAKAEAAAKQAERDAKCDRWTTFCAGLGPNGSVERFKSKASCVSSVDELRTMGIVCKPCESGCG